MTKKLIEIASEIVNTQVSQAPMSAADIASSLRQVFSALQELQKAETVGTDITVTPEMAPEEKPALSPDKSILENKVICLECGAEMKQLTAKHLSSHGLGQKEYKKKYGFSQRTPLSAKSLTKARSKAAKKRGLPEKLKQFIEARKQAKVEAAKPVAEQVKKPAKRAPRKKTA